MIKATDIFSIKNDNEFKNIGLDIFRHQAKNCPVYKKYIELRKIKVNKVSKIQEIPFLPINLFKNHKIISSSKIEEIIFESSGTTGNVKSKHYVSDLSVYKKSFIVCFEKFYGLPTDYCFIALLPTYSERKTSSLIFMVNELMHLSRHPENGYYLNNYEELYQKLMKLNNNAMPFILIGVSFALLYFVERYQLKLNNAIIMETGGMKGNREEITRAALHEKLKEGFGVKSIHSEYGMTELLSQAYSKKDGRFFAPPWMKIFIRDIYDPFSYVDIGKTGGINIIDLANMNSVSFIETQDIGRKHNDGSFEILGRFDYSEMRGCNLLVEG